ncbi:hypothetical protein ACQCN2_08450 [Brevibacillus ginsengisoli]|uniref:hypothetical protein n=1 Tax=Brevibacillus ginsengisoli TaxID=363854 RepID=UPI003CF6CCF0
MRKKIWIPLFLVFALVGMLLTGCGDKRAAKDVMLEAFKQQSSNNSYSFQGTMKFSVDADAELLKSDPSVATFIDALKKSELSYHGSTSIDPMQTEVILDAKIEFQGMSMNFNMPILFNQDKLWAKIPAIDFIPSLQQLKGKYVEIDLKQLSEMSKQPLTFTQNLKAQQEVGKKAADIVSKHLGQEYFVDVAKDAVTLPQDIKDGRVVKFQLTNDNLAPFVKTLLGSIVPEVLDVVASSELGKDMKKEDIDKTKEELQASLKEFETKAPELKKTVDIQKADFISVIDKENHVPYQLVDLKLKITPPEEKGSVTLGMTFDQKMSNFNQPPKWEISTPKPEEVVPYTSLMNGSF